MRNSQGILSRNIDNVNTLEFLIIDFFLKNFVGSIIITVITLV